MDQQTIIQILTPILDLFDQLGIPYRVGGSVATSYYGPWRGTQDVDIVADIAIGQVGALVAGLDPQQYLLDAHSIVDAILRQSSFNILERTTMNKIDVFIQKQTPHAQQEQQRARQGELLPGTRPIVFTTAEDMLLEKLQWWQLGGGVSTRQWNDMVNLIKRHAAQLDTTYVKTTAQSLGILPPLQRVYADAGVAFP
jgi:hypothetical protein